MIYHSLTVIFNYVVGSVALATYIVSFHQRTTNLNQIYVYSYTSVLCTQIIRNNISLTFQVSNKFAM